MSACGYALHSLCPQLFPQLLTSVDSSWTISTWTTWTPNFSFIGFSNALLQHQVFCVSVPYLWSYITYSPQPGVVSSIRCTGSCLLCLGYWSVWQLVSPSHWPTSNSTQRTTGGGGDPSSVQGEWQNYTIYHFINNWNEILFYKNNIFTV